MKSANWRTKVGGLDMSELPEIASVSELNADEGMLMVAFTSSNGERVNQHFGSSKGFYLYGVTADKTALLASKAFPKEAQDGNENKLKPKLSWLYGSDLVYCGSIGGSATKQLVMMGISPIQVTGGKAIADIVAELQAELAGELSPMLARVIKQKQKSQSEDRFDELEDEGWEE
jgi:nitrogen fixation protein NifX